MFKNIYYTPNNTNYSKDNAIIRHPNPFVIMAFDVANENGSRKHL